MNGEKLLMLGGLAFGGWYLYENFFAIPADAMYLGQANAAGTLPDGTTTVAAGQYVYYSPSLKKYYASSTAPTAAQIAAATPAAATTTPVAGAAPGTVTPVTTPATTTTPATSSSTAPASGTTTAAATLASIWASIQAGVATDPNFTSAGASPYRWNVYLSLAYPAANGVDLTKVFPGVDLNQNMTGSTYWAGMSKYLTTTYGLGIVGGSPSLYGVGLGQDPTDPATAAQTNPYYAWAVGGGSAPVDYTAQLMAANPGANAAAVAQNQALLNQPVATTTNLTPWLLGAAALIGVAMVAGGNKPRRYGP